MSKTLLKKKNKRKFLGFMVKMSILIAKSETSCQFHSVNVMKR